MAWLFAAVVLFLLVVSAGFRQFAGVVLLLCIAVGAWLYLENEREAKRLARSKPAVPVYTEQPSATLQGAKVATVKGGYRFVGRVINTGNVGVHGVKIAVSAKDCTGRGASRACIVIAETTVFKRIDIPPKQARDLDEYLFFLDHEPRPRGQLEWDYALAQASSD